MNEEKCYGNHDGTCRTTSDATSESTGAKVGPQNCEASARVVERDTDFINADRHLLPYHLYFSSKL